jgi:hypothetical protein
VRIRIRAAIPNAPGLARTSTLAAVTRRTPLSSGPDSGVVLLGDSFYPPPYQYRAPCIPDPERYGESHGGPRPRSVLGALLDGNPSVEWSGPSSECV